MRDHSPRPVLNLKRRQALAAQTAEGAAAGSGRPSGRQMVLAVAFVCLALGLLIVPVVLLNGGQDGAAASAEPAKTADRIVERDDAWLERADRVVPSEKLRQTIQESPGLRAGHREVQTSCLRINLRTVEGLGSPANAEGSGPVADKPPAPPESGTYPAAPPPRPVLEEGELPPPVEPDEE